MADQNEIRRDCLFQCTFLFVNAMSAYIDRGPGTIAWVRL
jgi:hypothetical protein